MVAETLDFEPVVDFEEISSSLPAMENQEEEIAVDLSEPPQLDIFTDTTIPEKKTEENENMMI